MAGSHLRQWGWFIGLWTASVLALGIVAAILKAVIG